MKKHLILMSCLIVLILCITMVQAQAVKVGLDVLDDNITVGEMFDVEVWVDGEGINLALLAFGFDVATSETYFTYTGYSLGPDFPGDFSDPFNPYNVAGGGLAISDDVLLATLSFTADALGSDSLAVAGLSDGFFYGLFYEDFIDADILASEDITINPVPEPATILLLVSGMAGLGVFGRKRFKKHRI